MATSDTTARDYAGSLLRSFDLNATRLPGGDLQHPAAAWADSGLMELTGAADRDGLMCPVPLSACADGALLALRALTSPDALHDVCGAGLLAERARMRGLQRNGAVSAGGACRLLAAADGYIAVNLPRVDDWELLPAWLETEQPVPSWDTLAAQVAQQQAAALVQRGQMMGMAVCVDRLPQTTAPAWCTTQVTGAQTQVRAARPLVVDLSSLWAGPLCTRLLHGLGADVVKVECTSRPDGARYGHAGFFARLNAGKHTRTLDLHNRDGLAELSDLLARADIVIEASRPRALRQLDINADALVRQNRGLTWVSITGYGRSAEAAERVAFGDDAGVAAGLSSLLHAASGQRVFCGDAIADPLTGVHAAVAAWAGHRAGGGRLLSVPMVDVVGHCISHDLPQSESDLRARQQAWTHIAMQHREAA